MISKNIEDVFIKALYKKAIIAEQKIITATLPNSLAKEIFLFLKEQNWKCYTQVHPFSFKKGMFLVTNLSIQIPKQYLKFTTKHPIQNEFEEKLFEQYIESRRIIDTLTNDLLDKMSSVRQDRLMFELNIQTKNENIAEILRLLQGIFVIPDPQINLLEDEIIQAIDSTDVCFLSTKFHFKTRADVSVKEKRMKLSSVLQSILNTFNISDNIIKRVEKKLRSQKAIIIPNLLKSKGGLICFSIMQNKYLPKTSQEARPLSPKSVTIQHEKKLLL